ncbi:MAG TPA: DUF1553 domain-containing protein [Fimbriimonadaceae bacterium]
MRQFLQLSMFLLLAAGIATMSSSATTSKDLHRVEFNRDIRPVIQKCFACHGPDAGARMMGLRLDQRDGAVTKLSDGKFAIVPGHPEESALIDRVFSKDPNMIMPPTGSNKFLSDDEKNLLKQWIKEGAEYKEHWGFVLPTRYSLPAVQRKDWPKNAIDYFILANLEDNQLSPSPEADKRTLIRRVTMDLIGLPPTLEEINNFLADKSPNAYEKVVDRLLASPRYGERMAMDWMDYSRYADSNGFQSDWERYQWRWRDWVIDAFNNNMPYDEFAKEQIAGDLYPHPTEGERLATGFNRNHRINTEGGVIPEEWRVENVIDRVQTTSETFLGLTAGCARCHDHKYDPISQKDFYSLCAYFNNVSETGSGVEMPVNHPPTMQAPTVEQAKDANDLKVKLIDLNSDLDDKLALNAGVGANWKPSKTAAPLASLSNGLVARYQLGNQPMLIAGKGPQPKAVGNVSGDIGRYTGSITSNDKAYVELGNVGDFDTHDKFSYGAWVNPANPGPGAAMARMDSNHDYVGWDLNFDSSRPVVHIISHWSDNALKVISKKSIPLNEWSYVFVTYDGSATPDGIKIYINGDAVEHTTEVNMLKGSIRNKVGATVGRRTGDSNFQGKIDDPVIYNRVVTPQEVANLADVSPAIPIVSISPEKRTAGQKQILDRYALRDTDPKFLAMDQERVKLQHDYEKLENDIPTAMIMDEGHPREAHVLIRGEYDHPGVKVTPGIPAALGALPKGAPNNRLGLAEWIASSTNPLTARVAVNRMWARLFGTGICSSLDDFGTRAEFPSHPELLDWLATEFVRLKWDQKAMWKELVMSATYRQSSIINPAAYKIDPGNRLLAHGPRFRLTGEAIRDQALLDGGLLVEKIGGPGVYPYMPAGIWDETNNYGNMRNYMHAKDSGLYRRSLYTIWKRTAAPPDMTVFDVPSREVCLIMRARTDTPMQALTLMNDVTFVEASRALAMRMLREGGSTEDSQIAFGFNVVLSRLPSAQELGILKAGLKKRLAMYKKDESAAKKLITEGDLKNDPKYDPAVIAAYTLTASTLFNLDEAVTKQ